ncbi:MAG: phosphoribosylaminoimidazolesuccinocarboxamide synthase [Luminiphilus sp.]|nr:phosphoribosylaminoimidazolesuccinocarboxamide synthase [Luminiphilus sp.]
MSTEVLAANDALPIRTSEPVHSGKVRSVYWLAPEDSARLIAQRHYAVAPDAQLAVMVISDRISAFDCIWHGEGGLAGVPGKGAALNAISQFWFDQFRHAGLARSHILEVPHPLVWIVQRAEPIMIEAIARRFITGSMWRAYERGVRDFCGIRLPDNLHRDQRLNETLVTPSTKGVMRGLAGIPEADDTNVSQAQLMEHWQAFGFRARDDVERYAVLLKEGVDLITRHLAPLDLMLVDTKFEFGYARDASGEETLIYMDEVGTPDSSRIWDAVAYRGGSVIENSKEEFRQALLRHVNDPQLLLDHNRFEERKSFARDHALPAVMLHTLSETYSSVAERITGVALSVPDRPLESMMAVVDGELDLAR